jgi:hypothetical protein
MSPVMATKKFLKEEIMGEVTETHGEDTRHG